MGSLRLIHVALLGLLVVPAITVAQSGGSGQASIYCCEIGGQPVCGDILPNACYGRAYREVTSQGRTRRFVQAPISDEEFNRRMAEERSAKEAESEMLRKRRLEQALLETYASLADLDARRDRELSDLDDTILKLREHEKELMADQQRLNQEIEAFKAGAVPRALQSQSEALKTKLSDQKALTESKLKERAAVSQKFADDRRRYIELQKTSK